MKARVALKIVRRSWHDDAPQYRESTLAKAFLRFFRYTRTPNRLFTDGSERDQPTTDWLLGQMLEPADLQP